MIRATYYAIIQFYFVVYAHNANFILESYSQPIVQYLHPLQPIAICHYMVHKQDMVRQTDNGWTAGLRTFQYPNVLTPTGFCYFQVLKYSQTKFKVG